MSDAELTPEEIKTIQGIRNRGFAVILWNPEELKDANPDKMEDRSIKYGWTLIDSLQ